jgi:hypothetical protein
VLLASVFDIDDDVLIFDCFAFGFFLGLSLDFLCSFGRFVEINLVGFEIRMVFVDFGWREFVQEDGAVGGVFAVLAQLERKGTYFVNQMVPGQYWTFLGSTNWNFGFSSSSPPSSTFSAATVSSSSYSARSLLSW